MNGARTRPVNPAIHVPPPPRSRRVERLLVGSLLLLCLALTPPPATAATVTVSSSADTGAGSLRQAVADATPGDTIEITAAAGPTITLASRILINKDLTITGPGRDVVAIDGNNATGLFEISSGAVAFSGLSFTHAMEDDSSGSVRGAAMAVRGPLTSLRLDHARFDGNRVLRSTGGFGGAIGFTARQTLDISDSVFTDNSIGADAAPGDPGPGGGSGGALFISSNAAAATIASSTFSGNRAGGDGGTADFSGFGSGGAISSGGDLTITNTTIAANRAGGAPSTGLASGQGRGGGLDFSGRLRMVGVTIARNTVGTAPDRSGSAIYTGSPLTDSTVIASIVADNSGATNCSFPLTTVSSSLEFGGAASCGFDLPSADPQLSPVADNGGGIPTMALAPTSPAVDAIPVADCPAELLGVDARGFARPDSDAACDLGAFELGSVTITSPATYSVPVGRSAGFTVVSAGTRTASLSAAGTLPDGATFTDQGDGTATLAGTPTAAGTFPLTITAANGIARPAVQSFTLVVPGPPTAAITAPTAGAIVRGGAAVATAFTCTDGVSGPGIATCTDGRGGTAAGGGTLDTTTEGPRTYTVTATSTSGLSGTASVPYTVDATAPATTDDVPGSPTAGPVAVTLTAVDSGGAGVTRTHYTTGTDPATPTTASPVYDPANRPVLGDGERIRYFTVDGVDNREAVRTSAAVRVASSPIANVDDVVRCSGRTVLITALSVSGSKVRIAGLAYQRLAGKKVTIVNSTRRGTVTTTVKPDGSFVATATRPKTSRRVRFAARIDGAESVPVHLTRQLTATLTGRRLSVRIAGRIGRGSQLRLDRVGTCDAAKRYRTVKIPRSGRVRLTLPTPAKGAVTLYRITARIRGSRLTASYSLPILIR